MVESSPVGATPAKETRGDPARSADELRSELTGAAERGEIVVFYQPQLDLRSETIVAVEALARWQHPRWGLVSPDEFVPVAEQAGLIEGITTALMATAFRDGGAWRSAGYPLEIAFNVAADQIFTPQFSTRIVDALAVDRFPPASVTVEITQSQQIEDYRAATAALAPLAALGIDISIDDFGTGFSSLSRLSALPATEVKIDRSVLESPSGKSMIDMVVALAHSNGLRVVAEGVETLQQLQLVRRLGCDRAQGFYIAAPLPADELVALLARG